MNLKNDETFQKISADMETNNGVMKDAWIVYKGEKWHPTLIKDQKTKISGFDVNFSGKRGKSSEVGRQKVPLNVFLEEVANGTFPTEALIRCKKHNYKSADGRHLDQIEFSARLNELISRIRIGQSPDLSASPVAPSDTAESIGSANAGQESAETRISENDQKDLEGDTTGLSTTEREAVVKVRFGQGAFRNSLLDIAGDVCWMSGIEGKELLVASHIQPWAHCDKNPNARGCPDNGLLLSSLWDAAFDAGLVTFDEDWRVVSSHMLSESAKRHLGLQQEKFLPECFRTSRRAEYLTYHRLVIFKR